jgi:hypothetical protein
MLKVDELRRENSFYHLRINSIGAVFTLR